MFYEAFSLSSGLDFSSSEGSRGQAGDSSDSSSSSLSPTSGYSSYDLLDTVDNRDAGREGFNEEKEVRKELTSNDVVSPGELIYHFIIAGYGKFLQ